MHPPICPSRTRLLRSVAAADLCDSQGRSCDQYGGGGEYGAAEGDDVLEGGGCGVAGRSFRARPQGCGEQAVGEDAEVGQAGRARQVRGQGPHDGHEPGEQNGLSAASGHECFGALPCGGGYAAAEAAGPQAAAQQVAGAVCEGVPGHHRARGGGDDQEQVQVTGVGQCPAGQQQRQGRDERADQQHGLGQHRGGQDGVGGRGRHVSDQAGQRVHRAAPAMTVRAAAGVAGARGRPSCQTLAGGRLPHTVQQPVAYRRW